MKPVYHSLEDLIKMIDEPNQSVCLRILQDNIGLFKTVQGSSHNHQAWPGGYYDHIVEVMNIGLIIYNQFNSIRPLPCTVSDVMLILFLHDIEKPWKYELINGKAEIKPELQDKEKQREFRNKKLEEYGIQLTEEQRIGMIYVEGEHKNYSPKQRAMNPLAALCHIADTASARIWFDYPTLHDPWDGAMRIAK